jgi:hypothetical protein
MTGILLGFLGGNTDLGRDRRRLLHLVIRHSRKGRRVKQPPLFFLGGIDRNRRPSELGCRWRRPLVATWSQFPPSAITQYYPH